MSEKIAKRIAKSKKIPADKKEEVLEAFSHVDLDLIINNPEAMADVLANPGHLAYYTKDQQAEATNENAAKETENELPSDEPTLPGKNEI